MATLELTDEELELLHAAVEAIKNQYGQHLSAAPIYRARYEKLRQLSEKLQASI